MFLSSGPLQGRAGKFTCPSLYSQARTVMALWNIFSVLSTMTESFPESLIRFCTLHNVSYARYIFVMRQDYLGSCHHQNSF